MVKDAPAEAEHRPAEPVARERRRGHRLSVWHLLVAIALPPCLGVAALAALFATDRVAAARDAQSIERSMTTIQLLDDVRRTIDAEATAIATPDTLTGLGIPAAQVKQITSVVVPEPAEEAAREVDLAIAAVRADPAMAAPLDAVTGELASAREPPASPAKGSRASKAKARAFRTIVGYRRVLDLVADAQRDVAVDIAAGGRGAGSPDTMRAAVRLAEVSDVVLLASRRLATLYLAYLAPARELPEVRADLRDVDAQYRRTVADLPPQLSPELQRQWEGLAAEGLVKLVDGYVGRNIEALTGGDDAAPRPQDLFDTSRAVSEWNARTITFLKVAVDEGTAAAAADRDAAGRRAVLTVVVAAALLAITLGTLLFFGGLLRRRLGAVADGARRLSAGHLEPMEVRGPREAAVAATGLNDAAASLRQVLSTVEHLAAGDLDSPELRRPTPGPLGAAVHASVELLTDAIRERERLQGELRHRAAHDALTGLPNRSEAERLLTQALGEAAAGDGDVGLLFVDLDHFKQINDTHGHHAGDHALQVAAGRMRAAVGPVGEVCRLGGDEFVVILAGIHPLELEAMGERLVRELAASITYQGAALRIGASVGAAISGPGRATADELLILADRAAYNAKSAGRGRLALAH